MYSIVTASYSGNSSVQVSTSSQVVSLNWEAPDSQLVGYYIYRASTRDGPFTLLTPQSQAAPSFTDSAVPNGTYFYMIQAAKRELNGGGSFINLSQGKVVAVTVTGITAPAAPENLQALP